MKKYFLIGLVSFCLVFGLTTNFCFGEQNEINLYFFWGQGCPHCAQEKIFLEYRIKGKLSRSSGKFVYPGWQFKNTTLLLPLVTQDKGDKIDE